MTEKKKTTFETLCNISKETPAETCVVIQGESAT